MIDNEILRGDECEAVIAELSAYIDGELSENEVKHIEEHLEKCEKCRRLMSELSSLSEDIGIASVPYPADLHSRIMDSLDDEMKKGREKSRAVRFGKLMKKHGMWLGAGVAAVICLVLVGSPLFRGSLEFAANDAKDMAVEMEDAIMPQIGGIEVASEMGRASDEDGVYYSYTADEPMEKAESIYLSDSLLDGAEELMAEDEMPAAGKTAATDMTGVVEETVTAKNEIGFFEAEYKLLPSFMLPRGELG